MSSFPLLGDFDDVQRGVIELPCEHRAVVVAGPGTGKTAVACARLARLAMTGVPGSALLMISFTRTAVAEMRNRMRVAAGSAPTTAGVRIVTLDSEAWRLRHGFTEEETRRFGGYDANIDVVLKMLRTPADDVRDYFEIFRHVVVDEAQDLTEQRAALVRRILDLLAPDCGFTVFGDPAQAIYDFTADDDGERGAKRRAVNLLESLESRRKHPVEVQSLQRIYRAANPTTLNVFRAARDVVLDTSRPGSDCHQALLDFLHREGGRPSKELEDELLYGDTQDADDVLWLFRQRREALETSAELHRKRRPHRLRLPGLPVWLDPWVAGIFAISKTNPQLRRERFEMQLADEWDAEMKDWRWARLLEVAGTRDGGVDLTRFRGSLEHAKQDHPFARQDFGSRGGPILGTIHASKGRESRRVLLELGMDRSPAEGADEEARVAYVGATRALQELYVRPSTRRPSRRADHSNRVFSPGRKSARIELGLAGDIELGSPVARSLHASVRDAEEAQLWLANLDDVPIEVAVVAERVGERWRNVLVPLIGPPLRLAELGREVYNDVFEIGRSIGIQSPRPPRLIADLHLVGVRTVLVPSGLSRSLLYEPWATYGAYLEPVVHGFPRVGYNLQSGARHGHRTP